MIFKLFADQCAYMNSAQPIISTARRDREARTFDSDRLIDF
jgi:hypothetical protein